LRPLGSVSGKDAMGIVNSKPTILMEPPKPPEREGQVYKVVFSEDQEPELPAGLAESVRQELRVMTPGLREAAVQSLRDNPPRSR